MSTHLNVSAPWESDPVPVHVPLRFNGEGAGDAGGAGGAGGGGGGGGRTTAMCNRPLTLWYAAVMSASPGPTPVTSPVVLTVATELFDELQVA